MCVRVGLRLTPGHRGRDAGARLSLLPLLSHCLCPRTSALKPSSRRPRTACAPGQKFSEAVSSSPGGPGSGRTLDGPAGPAVPRESCAPPHALHPAGPESLPLHRRGPAVQQRLRKHQLCSDRCWYRPITWGGGSARAQRRPRRRARCVPSPRALPTRSMCSSTR